MKINKLSIFAVVLAILVSAFVCINVSAEGEAEGTLAVKSINIAYDDHIQLLVAVDAGDVEWSDIEVTYTIDGSTKIAPLHPTETCLKDGVTYPVFYAEGIAPKDIGKAMTFVARNKVTGATGAPYSASILDYLYARLYKNGYNDATEGENLAKKNLYQNTIDYASSALDVLVNYKLGKSETLYNEYVFIWSDDEGVNVDGSKPFSAVISGTEVTPNAAADISKWTLLNVDGTAQGEADYGDTIAVTAHTKLVAVEAAPAEDTYVVMDYENGVSSDYVKSYDKDGNLITGNYVKGDSVSLGLGEGGNYLQVRNPANGGTGITEVELSNTYQTGNCYTFETKIFMAGVTKVNANFARIRFENAKGGDAMNLIIGVDDSAAKYLNIAASGSITGNVTANQVLFKGDSDATALNKNWITIRVEFYFPGAGVANTENTYLKLFVNDTLAYSDLATWAVGADIDHAEITHIPTTTAISNIYYDDIYFTRTDKAYVKGNN